MFHHFGTHNNVERGLTQPAKNLVIARKNLKPAHGMGLPCNLNATLTQVNAHHGATARKELARKGSISASHIQYSRSGTDGATKLKHSR
jgi:hypothetical protein